MDKREVFLGPELLRKASKSQLQSSAFTVTGSYMEGGNPQAAAEDFLQANHMLSC